jgi:hypothetical protein
VTTTAAPDLKPEHTGSEEWPTLGRDPTHATREEFDAHSFDPTQGREIGTYDDPTQGRKELYVSLGGSGWIDVDSDRIEFGPRTMIHVTPESVRQPVSGAEGHTYLCVGAPPEAPYRPIDKFV